MYSSKSASICLALFLALIEIGSCLQCYHCTSQNDPKCGTTFTSSITAMDCKSQDSLKFNQLNLYNTLPSDMFGAVQGAPKFCHKFMLESGTVARTCLEGNSANKEQTCKALIDETKNSTPDKKVKSCVVCDKDNCNGAGALSMSLPLSALTLVIAYLMYKQ